MAPACPVVIIFAFNLAVFINLEKSMLFIEPNQPDSRVNFKSRYGNYIGGQWLAPVKGKYFENISPVNGKVFCEIPRSEGR